MYQSTGAPITNQPGQHGFAMQSRNPKLAVLEPMSYIKVHQKFQKECLELCGCNDYENEYRIKDETDTVFWLAKEQSSCKKRACYANLRPFTMPICDMDGNEVLRFERPLKCQGWSCMSCYPDSMQRLDVYSGSDYLGKVLEYPSICTPKWKVLDANDRETFDIVGPWGSCTCCSDADFPITSVSGEEVGTIRWYYRGWKSELTVYDVLSLNVPKEMAVETKAVLLGAVLLVDFNLFEQDGNQ